MTWDANPDVTGRPPAVGGGLPISRIPSPALQPVDPSTATPGATPEPPPRQEDFLSGQDFAGLSLSPSKARRLTADRHCLATTRGLLARRDVQPRRRLHRSWADHRRSRLQARERHSGRLKQSSRSRTRNAAGNPDEPPQIADTGTDALLARTGNRDA